MRNLAFLLIILPLFAVGCLDPQDPDPDPDPIVNDNDKDGIPDDYELPGKVWNNMPLYSWGARQNQRDLFVEIDYMNSTNEGLTPRREALQMIVDAFAVQGIVVHFDVGDIYDSTDDQSGNGDINPAAFDLGGGNSVPYASPVSLLPFPVLAQAYARNYRNNYMDFDRRHIFYYMLFGSNLTNGIGGTTTSLGIAEVGNTVSLITLEHRNLNSADAEETNALINIQALTAMHEFGHNLGLRHGGNNDVLFKPNYVSTMNYLYSGHGIPPAGSDEGDRFYLLRNMQAQNTPGSYLDCVTYHPTAMQDVAGNIFDGLVTIDFSHGTNTDINEADINENEGIGSGSGIAVDYDCDGNDYETSVAVDLYEGGQTTLRDHDDWGSIKFYHDQSVQALSGGSIVYSDPLPSFD